jgi:YD repeat-containing protein
MGQCHWEDGVRSIAYQYNVLNQLIDVTDQTSTKLSEYAYGYDNLDRIKSIDNLGIGGVAHVALNYAYDALYPQKLPQHWRFLLLHLH